MERRRCTQISILEIKRNTIIYLFLDVVHNPMLMKGSLLAILFLLIGVYSQAQTIQSIFDWRANSEIVTKDYFRPLFPESYSVSPNDPMCKVYILKSYEVRNRKGEVYTIKLHCVNEADPKSEDYDGFSIHYQGKEIFTYYSQAPLYNSDYITTGKSKERFLQVPLTESSFALCFGGWLYGYDNAPELVIVVVSGSKAKVVFDNYAYAYKYTPSPNFSIEYITKVDGLFDKPEPIVTPAFLRKHTKHKIWKEGDVLKYTSWK